MPRPPPTQHHGVVVFPGLVDLPLVAEGAPLDPVVAPPHEGHVTAPTTTTTVVLLLVCHQMLLQDRIVQGARFARKSVMKPIFAGSDMMIVMLQKIVLQTWRLLQVLIQIGT